MSNYCSNCSHYTCQTCGNTSKVPNLDHSMMCLITKLQCKICGCFTDVDIKVDSKLLIKPEGTQHWISKQSEIKNDNIEYINPLTSSDTSSLAGLNEFINYMNNYIARNMGFVRKPDTSVDEIGKVLNIGSKNKHSIEEMKMYTYNPPIK